MPLLLLAGAGGAALRLLLPALLRKLEQAPVVSATNESVRACHWPAAVSAIWLRARH